MRYFSLFSGIGGFELGIQQAYEKKNSGVVNTSGQVDTIPSRQKTLDSAGMGNTHAKQSSNGTDKSSPLCIGYSEIDKYAIQIYQKHFRQPKTREEIESDLDELKTIVSTNNYNAMEVCYVNNAKKETSFIKTTNQLVKSALEDTNSNGVKKILSKAGQRGENIMLCEDNECSICMGEDVYVAENLKKCSLPLNIKTEMDTLNESNMELAICINSPLKNICQTDTKSYVITVITLKEDTTYAHIKKTKPHRNFGDITKINTEDLPDFDTLVGGFPCQSFSIAGKRKGFEDTRGTLFFEIARILAHKKPRLFLLENVKGLLSHDNGNTFKTIISTLDELGYDLQWQVLNSKNFGVPQNRERVFIVGHLRGTPRPEVFPITESNSKNIEQLNQPKHSNDRIYGTEGLAPTLNTMQGGRRQPKVLRQPLRFLTRNQKNIEGDYSFTVDSSQTSGVKVDGMIRRLTPKECERLQGFSDNWTDGVSDTQRYKMCGNAVTVNVIQAIMEKLL